MIKPELLQQDSFSAPTPGQSFTDTPQNYLWEQPAQISDPIEAYEQIMQSVRDPINRESIGKLMFAGISIETLTNSIMSKNFSEGIISVDVAEILKPPLAMYMLEIARDMGIEPKVVNTFPKEPMSDVETVELLRQLNPKKYNEFRENYKSTEDKVIEQEKSKGFMPLLEEESV